MNQPRLFTPLAMRGVRAKNRIVVAPMCQYSAHDGLVGEWHAAHHERFALGGVGLGFVEATGVEARGRITHGCTGIWLDAHIEPMARIAAAYHRHGALAGIQIGHAGRKASSQRPWEGNGPLGDADAERGDAPWACVAPSPVAVMPNCPVPRALETDEIPGLVEAFAAAARRALAAGFDAVEIHGAHGYLVHSFLSPIANRRDDAYGGMLAKRMRFALEVAEAVRAVWPADKPLFFRTSAVDGVEGGWTLDDTAELCRALAGRGVDVVDCSSGGIGGATASSSTRPSDGFQVPYAARVRRDGGLMSMAVGFIRTPELAESILAEGSADLIAIARELLFDPFWPLHAAQALGCDPEWTLWPNPYRFVLWRRAQLLAKAAE